MIQAYNKILVNKRFAILVATKLYFMHNLISFLLVIYQKKIKDMNILIVTPWTILLICFSQGVCNKVFTF